MSVAKNVKLFIKVVINKEKTKILFAEAGSDFTDILISFLTLPLGTIVKVLKKHYGEEEPVIGSLNTLYNGVANLDSVHFHKASKNILLNPRSSYERCWQKLKINYTDLTSSNSVKIYDGVFTESADSFIISDDLEVMPIVAGSVINTLSNLSIDITDMDGAETRNVAFGFNEIMALLKGLLISRNTLSDILLHGSQMKLATVKYEHKNTHIDEKDISMNPKKMVLKAMIQKSTFKLLFAQADTDFINFLFGLLILPLRRVEQYLGSNTGLKNIDNLHQNIVNIPVVNFDKHSYEWTLPKIRSNESRSNEFSPLNFDPNIKKIHVEGSRMYMVSDDLTVAPLGITSSLSVINKLKISLSDVRELELQVGLEEGLNIVKAALTSTTALTDGLIKPMLEEPKQERKLINILLCLLILLFAFDFCIHIV